MIALLASAWAAETVLVAPGSTWSYLDTGVPPDPAWTTEPYDDAAWATGLAPLGYGFVTGLVTSVGYGPDPLNRYVTTWFRQDFAVADLDAFEAISLHVRRDDGVVVYVNGAEVFRDNLPPGPVTDATLAIRSLYGADQDVFLDVVLPDGVVVEGDNVVAVEVHQQSPISNDLVMDVKISGWDGPSAITRGPWIQSRGPNGAVVRWKTDGPSASRLSWGTAIGALGDFVDDASVSFDHELAVTGAAANTVVTYAVGTPEGLVLAGDDADHRFRTAPTAGVARPTRIWVLGDSGTANVSSEAVRDAYAAFAPDPLDTDVWLMLGDNAYPSGTLADYERAVFQFYPQFLRQLSLWPAIGNHDGYSSFSDTQSGPYFDLFTLPDEGEAGGEPSGTEAYWSFDHGNIHFVCLDSYHSDRAPGSPMLTWLEADLAAATDADWLIAFWHHPPYSKGSHNSDFELEMVEMRENVVPILEDHGVDLTLTGHSHSYERSLLIDGHYGTTSTWDPMLMALQDHDGDPQVGGAYTKWPSTLSPHQGAVHIVAGASGQISGGALDHPAMHVSMSTLGSLVVDIDGDLLEARYVDDLGAVVDSFAIRKGVTTIVQMTGDTLGTEAELLDFQGLAYEPDGSEVPTYSWDWGDGGPDTLGAVASHAWATEGGYTVTLSATDTSGYVATDTLHVDIDNGPPVIDQLEVTPGAVEGTQVTFTGHATDPGGDPVTYEWEIQGALIPGDVVNHVFTDDGEFEVILTARDDAGREVSDILPVSVANAPPVASGVTVEGGIEGSEATLVAEADDPGAADWLTGTWDVAGEELTGLFVLHEFRASGAFPFTLTVRDDDGGEDVLTGVIDIANVPPVVETAAFDGVLLEGSAISFSATASDAGLDDVVTFSWDFGDGSGWIVGDRVDHVFPDQGPWEVFVAAEDGDGGLDLAKLDVGLANVPASIDALVGPSVVDEGADVLWRVDTSDPGAGDVLTARWSFGDEEAVGLSVIHAFPDEGTYAVAVEVTDDEGAGESASTEVTVRNAAPVFESEPDTLVGPGRDHVYAPRVRDPDPVALSLEGPEGAVLADGVVRWTAPEVVGTERRFTLTADDGEGGVATQSWTVVVAEASAAPGDRWSRDRLVGDACGCGGGPARGAPILLVLAALARRRRVG